ncbi:DUF4440 domain-containing protein [Paenarthrobacter nicotinovorans]|uniref:RraA family protein n=1 Tax=Paenarthrobacter nicotinovorans TaxID=29320 RepID=UPI003822078C
MMANSGVKGEVGQAALLQADDLRYEALLGHDAAKLADLLDDDFVYVHSSGLKERKDSFVGGIASGRVVYNGVDLGEREVWVDDRTATICGDVILHLAIGGEARVLDITFLSVWVRSQEGWVLRSWASVPRRKVAAEVSLSEFARHALGTVATTTVAQQLSEHGIHNVVMSGLHPTRPDDRMVGSAYTLRYVPMREDVSAKQEPGSLNAQQRAVEEIGSGQVLVIDARGLSDAGTIGDIFSLRVHMRGGAGVVTDGALRDTPAVADLPIPVYHKGSHAAVVGELHHPLETNVPIACGGTLVMPGDIIVGDGEGVVVVPSEMAEDIARSAWEQHVREEYILEKVRGGESLRGLYPLPADRMTDYEAWRLGNSWASTDAGSSTPMI